MLGIYLTIYYLIISRYYLIWYIISFGAIHQKRPVKRGGEGVNKSGRPRTGG